MTPNEALKKYFGYDQFRDRQAQVIDDVMAGNNALVVMPTGGGKSICFQIPALMLPGITIVVSPLIALMKDQVDGLLANGIEAAYINSMLDEGQINAIIKKMTRNELKLLYVAPERLQFGGGKFLSFLKTIQVSLFAIDEAHCISTWGHDFRPEYLTLHQLKIQFPTVPILALTASADAVTRKDIIQKLGFDKHTTFISSFNRPNLHYFIEKKKNALQSISDYLNKHKDESGIIYALSRTSTESIAKKLNAFGFNAKYYHAGMEANERNAVQDDFRYDRIKVIVATIAFGMGIDKSNVRYVMHYNLPKNIESYYQETGRAGRDGIKSDVILYYSWGDVEQLKKFATIDDNPKQTEILIKKLNQITHFCEAKQCRRKMLLQYFGEEYHLQNCGSCDYCLASHTTFDATIIAQKALSAVARTGERFGVAYLVDFLRGSKSEKIKEQHKWLKTYGIGADISKALWLSYFKELIDQNYLLRDQSGDYPIIKLTPKSNAVLLGAVQVFLDEVEEVVTEQQQNLDFDQDLFTQLKKVRLQFSLQENVPAFVIFSDATLVELATYLPLTVWDLNLMNGFGEVKIKKYGEAFLLVISAYCELHQIDSRISLKTNKPSSKQKNTSKIDTKELSLALFKSGKSLIEIAEERKMSIPTIETHITYFVEKGLLPIEQLVAPQKINLIKLVVKQLGAAPLTPIKEKLGDAFTWTEIKATIAYLKYHKEL